MVESIANSNINAVQMISAANAFKNSATIKPQIQEPQVSDGMGVNNNDILKDLDLKEIKDFAKTLGEEDLSNDDIKYGITYGRSVIADYMI